MADSIYALTDQTITITRGQTYNSGTMTVTSDSAGATPVDLTNADIIVTVKQSDNGAILIRKSVDGTGVTIDDAAQGEYSFVLEDSDTDGWNPNTYFYDIVVKDEPTAGETWYHVKRSKFVVQASEYSTSGGPIRATSAVDFNVALIHSGGSELDGDKVDIDWNPTYYTPVDVAETDDTDDLSAHLKGIDNAVGINALTALGSVDGAADYFLVYDASASALKKVLGDDLPGGGGGVTSHGDLDDLLVDDHTQYLLADGSRELTDDLAVTALKTIDGRDLSVDGTKLDGIEALATADQTGAEIKALYEAEADTNAYDDAAVTKLAGIATGAIANVVEDTTPQLGGDLDANAFDLQFDDATGIRDDSDNEQLIFQKTASAVTYLEITNNTTGNPPKLAAAGESNVVLNLDAPGTGTIQCLQAAGAPKVTLSDAATIATDASLGNTFEVTITANRTLGNPTNMVSGFAYVWIIKQDGSGNHTLDYDTAFWFNGGTAPVVPVAASAIMVVTGVYDGTRLLCSFDGEDGFATT